jgi:hypothetical protein
MRITQFQIVLLVGFMFLASSASAQKGPGGGKEGEREGGRAADNAPHRGGGNDLDRAKDAVHNDAGRAKSAVRDNIDRSKIAAPNNAGRRGVGNTRAGAGTAPRNLGRTDVRVSPRVNIGGPKVNIAGPNAWRYRQYNNRWWYWMPNNSWVYWNNGAWLPYRALAGSRYYNGPYASGYRGTDSFAGGYLGVSFDPQYRNVAVISQVNANSPAEAAGLQRGDVLRTVNGHEIRSAYEPSSMIRQHAPGTEVTLSIERDRQVTEVAVVLGRQ